MVGRILKTLTPKVANEIKDELANIPEKYQKDFNSTHEGLAVIWEGFEELKDEVFFGWKRINNDWSNPHELVIDQEHKARLRKEAIQIAAMCVRFIQELT